MDQNAVRRAIYDDFALSGADVVISANALEQTQVLTIDVPDLLPESGLVTIGYVFGRSGGLIQVTLLWGLADTSVQTEALELTAARLIAYFAEQGYVSETGPDPVVFADGSNLLFYTRDARGGGLALSALPRRATDDDLDTTPILRLAYSANLDNPDIFRSPAIRP